MSQGTRAVSRIPAGVCTYDPAISRENTPTLNLERVLPTIVNVPQAVIPYERGGSSARAGWKAQLSSCYRFLHVTAGAPDISALNDISRWAMLSEEVVHVRQHGTEIDAEREEIREIVQFGDSSREPALGATDNVKIWTSQDEIIMSQPLWGARQLYLRPANTGATTTQISFPSCPSTCKARLIPVS